MIASCRRVIREIEASEDKNMLSEANLKKKEALEREAISMIRLPDPDALSASEDPRPNYAPCKHAFFDLGTNVGDSVGIFLDASLDACTPLWERTELTADFPRPRISDDLSVAHAGEKANPLYDLIRRYAVEHPDYDMREACVYGMEGNPHFTERLRKLENFVMEMDPRPVRHLHIHTESIIVGKDGPTKLYLDKSTVKKNFWGSSIFDSAVDVSKTAKKNGGVAVAHDVDGISLTSLVKNTMIPFRKEDGGAPGNGLLIIKMDVEGAEYQVLKDVAESDVLCEYIAANNRVVMIVEWHDQSIKDATQMEADRSGHEAVMKKLTDCGVKFEDLGATWS